MINDDLLDAIDAAVTASGFTLAGMASVKQAFAGIRLTYCLVDDMEAKRPFRECDGFSLFLVGASDHCLGLTYDFDQAIGVIIAEE
jgi:hypothetical protein